MSGNGRRLKQVGKPCFRGRWSLLYKDRHLVFGLISSIKPGMLNAAKRPIGQLVQSMNKSIATTPIVLRTLAATLSHRQCEDLTYP